MTPEQEAELLRSMQSMPKSMLTPLGGKANEELQSHINIFQNDAATGNEEAAALANNLNATADPNAQSHDQQQQQQQAPTQDFNQATQPTTNKMVTFKLSDIITPSFFFTIMDFVLSFGGEKILGLAGMDIPRDELKANEEGKEVILHAITPSFDKIEVKTDNPLIAIGLAYVSVYAVTISDAIEKHKKAVETGEKQPPKPKRKKTPVKRKNNV